MDYQRLYEYRFKDMDQDARMRVWGEIAAFLYEKLERPQRVLDPAAGRGEFINALPSADRWRVDLVAYEEAEGTDGIRSVEGDALTAELPTDHFDAIFVSNFLEHLSGQEEIAAFLKRMHACARPGGLIAVMGPNYRYCAREYWDFADHIVPLTHRAVEEHLYAAGFTPEETWPRFLPYSFTGLLPASRRLTAAYLRLPPLWWLLGKQFLVLGRR